MDRYKVIKMADELLNQLGHYVDPEAKYGTMELDDDYCELNIPKHDLRLVRMHKTGEIIAYYNNKKMFDRNINITGIWQQILEESYDELDQIKERQREKANRIATCNIISKNLSYFIDGMDKLHVHQIAIPLTNNILVQVHSNKDEHHRDMTITSVYYNNEEVFTRIYKERYGNNPTLDKEIEYTLYVPGKWESKLETLRDSAIEETKKVRHINNINN